MDHIVNLLVKGMIFLSRFAPVFSKLGFLTYRKYEDPKDGNKWHLLLVGYSGARNTGSDVRVAEIARQLQDRLGKDQVAISVLTLDPDSIRCYFEDDVKLIPVRSIFFGGVFKACCANQAAILCEGSTLKSQFANALTLYTCEAAGIMKNQHKPCIAYGSEAGEMDAFLERTVKKCCSRTYFIARSENSLDRIHQLGFQGHLGTDAAWKFDSTSYTDWAKEQLKQSGWDGETFLLGVAPVNPFWWPVKPSLFRWLKAKLNGDHTLQFQLWYFFSWSKEREKQLDHYLDAIASAVNDYAETHPCQVVLFGMEGLDSDVVGKLKQRLDSPVSTFLSSDCNGYEMAALLRQLSLLITSRYHAEVLSMENKVPSVVISMDERLDNIMQEMEMAENQLLHTDDKDLSAKLKRSLDYVEKHRESIREELSGQLSRYQNRFDEMGDFLIHYLLFYPVEG